MKTTATAMVHSTETKQEVEIIRKNGDNDYIVKTKDGITCHAIFNPFVGCYYADDIYAII